MKHNKGTASKEISRAIRAKNGKITGFILNNKTKISREQALIEARQGNLIGINLYPGFVKEVVNQHNKEGLLTRIIQTFTGKSNR